MKFDKILFFLLDMTELNTDDQEVMNEENLNDDDEDELDFYDFLEVVSDRIDNITTQSKKRFVRGR